MVIKVKNKKVTLKEIQRELLSIIKDFDVFCKENNIKYYLMGGSALGAIRHQGFIPWDDDIDVFMTRTEYLKLLKIAEEKMDKEKYYLQKEATEEFPMYFSKWRKNNTTFIEEDFRDRKNMHQGFCIDIMCLYNTYENKFLRRIQYLAAACLKSKALAETKYKRNNKKKMAIIKICNIFVRGPIKKIIRKISYGPKNDNSKYVGHFFGRAKFPNTSFERNYLGKQRYVKFEDTKLPVPEKAEEYLRLRYGNDFMKAPDEKTKSLYPRHDFIVDLNKNYTEYINNGE